MKRSTSSKSWPTLTTYTNGLRHLLKRVFVSSGVTEKKFDGGRRVLTHLRSPNLAIHVHRVGGRLSMKGNTITKLFAGKIFKVSRMKAMCDIFHLLF